MFMLHLNGISLMIGVLQVIAVTFVSMDIETHTSCNWDYIEIYNGNEFVRTVLVYAWKCQMLQNRNISVKFADALIS